MKIIPVNFHIANEDLLKTSTEAVEESITDEIMSNITKAIIPMIDSENFVEMAPSEDGNGFDVSINIMIGSASEYIDATSLTTTNLLNLCMDNDISKEEAIDIISDATHPLIALVK